ncbi:MAG: hypothetical protein HYY84_06325 [Deltaproteobacteria bacterium]|nr:hypothetical protein [Deltaproteobacteria bacterium]
MVLFPLLVAMTLTQVVEPANPRAACFSGKPVIRDVQKLVTLGAFESYRGAPNYLRARKSGRNFVLLVDDDGAYEATNWSSGREVYGAVESAVRAYYDTQPDDVHFITIITSFPIDFPGAFYLPLSNDTRGIGYRNSTPGGDEVFDQTFGLLEGILMINQLGWYGRGSDWGNAVFLQELAHRWCSFVHFDDNGVDSDELLGRDDSHWSYFFESGGSPMEGNAWRDDDGPSWVEPVDAGAGADADAGAVADADAGAEPDAGAGADGDAGTVVDAGPPVRTRHRFTTTTQYTNLDYSWLDLYVMGLARPDEVPPMLLIQSPDVARAYDMYGQRVNRASPPQWARPVQITGLPRRVGIEDIIRVEGARVPDSTTSRKEHRVGFVLVVRAGEANDTRLLDRMKSVVDDLVAKYGTATRGRSTLVAVSSDTNIPEAKPLGEHCATEADCAADAPLCTRAYQSVWRFTCTKRCFRDAECGEGYCCGRTQDGYANACFARGTCYEPPDAGAATTPDAGSGGTPTSTPPTLVDPNAGYEITDAPPGGCACGVGAVGGESLFAPIVLVLGVFGARFRRRARASR